VIIKINHFGFIDVTKKALRFVNCRSLEEREEILKNHHYHRIISFCGLLPRT
jgi:hypothetical protein